LNFIKLPFLSRLVLQISSDKWNWWRNASRWPRSRKKIRPKRPLSPSFTTLSCTVQSVQSLDSIWSLTNTEWQCLFYLILKSILYISSFCQFYWFRVKEHCPTRAFSKSASRVPLFQAVLLAAIMTFPAFLSTIVVLPRDIDECCLLKAIWKPWVCRNPESVPKCQQHIFFPQIHKRIFRKHIENLLTQGLMPTNSRSKPWGAQNVCGVALKWNEPAQIRSRGQPRNACLATIQILTFRQWTNFVWFENIEILWHIFLMLSYTFIWLLYEPGWWFQTFFIFHNIWDSPSHWLIFFKMVKTTNQERIRFSLSLG